MHESDGESPAEKSGSLAPRRLQSVGTEPIRFPDEDDSLWADETSALVFVGHLGDPELRERALRILACSRADTTRELVFAKIKERWSSQPWAAEIEDRLRSRWSRVVAPEISGMLDVLAEVADGVMLQDVVGIYVLAQTDRQSTRSWSAGVYDRTKMAFAFGVAQLEIYHGCLYGRRDVGEIDEEQ